MKWLFSKNEITPLIIQDPTSWNTKNIPTVAWVTTGDLHRCVKGSAASLLGFLEYLMVLSHIQVLETPLVSSWLSRVGVLPVCDWLYRPKKTHWLLEVFPLFISQELHFVIRAIKSHAWATSWVRTAVKLTATLTLEETTLVKWSKEK